MLKRSIVIATFLCYVIAVGFHVVSPTGWVGVTRKNPAAPGCFCHDPQASDSVTVWVTGPQTVQVASKQDYTVFMKGGPASAGGFNVASGRGILSAFDSSAHVESGELTHSFPKSFQQDTVRWKYFYQAPAAAGRDTIFSVGNNVDLDGVSGPPDKWNFGTDFVINIVDSVVNVTEAERPSGFQLSQNYPNPFNSKTKITLRIQVSSYTTLKVYDIRGEEVTTIVDGLRPPGSYEVEWDAIERASSIYFYRLVANAIRSGQAGDPSTGSGQPFIETKKMVYLR